MLSFDTFGVERTNYYDKSVYFIYSTTLWYHCINLFLCRCMPLPTCQCNIFHFNSDMDRTQPMDTTYTLSTTHFLQSVQSIVMICVCKTRQLFSVDDMLSEATDGDVVSVTDMATDGAIILATSKWNCNLDRSEDGMYRL